MGCTAIVDYGVGNLKSVTNAIEGIWVSEPVSPAMQLGWSRPIPSCCPGVGAFPDAAQRLRSTGLEQIIREEAVRKPILGICLGMQLLFEQGEEGFICEGLKL